MTRVGWILLGLGVGGGALALLSSSSSALVPPAPRPAPDECDPLRMPPPGKLCVDSGGRFVLVPEALGPSGVGDTSGNEVRFAADLSRFEVGSQWKIKVLDQWLERERMAGRLATINVPVVRILAEMSIGTILMVSAIGVATAPEAVAATLIGGLITTFAPYGEETREDQEIAKSGAAAFARFCHEHNVIVGVTPTRISQVAYTPAVGDFLRGIAEYIAGFQRRQF